jgi:hypothetical protein
MAGERTLNLWLGLLVSGMQSMPVPPEITQLVNSSGNTFHARVARWLRDKEWHIVVSPYYMDQTQNKAREIDLIAEKLWPVPGRFGNSDGYVAVRLFVECKFVPSHSVFWFAEKSRSEALALVCSSGEFPENNIYTEKHHYLAQSQRVAKLFATSGGRAQEAEPFYKALNQSLNATVAMRGMPLSVPSPKSRLHNVRSVLEFPVVVCSSFDNLFAVDFYADTEPEPITQNFQLEVRYAYIDQKSRMRDEYFLLDFVEFSQLDQYVEWIDEDAKKAAAFSGDK